MRRRYAVVLVGALVGVALGFVVSATIAPPVPTATVGIEVLPTGVDLSQSSTRGSTALDIDRAIVRMTSQSVLEAAVAEFGSPLSVDELREAVDARQLNEAPLVELTVEDDEPTDAAAAADAVAAAYLANEAADALAVRGAQIDEIQGTLDEAYSEIGATGVQIGSTEDPARIAALNGQRDAALRRAAELERQLVVLAAQNVDPGRVVRPSEVDVPGRPLGEVVAVPATAALGLLVGFGIALLVDRSDRRVWEPEDVARVTGSANVVAIDRSDLTGDGLRSGGGHRRLRALVAPRQLERGSVLVTGADADRGAGVAAGLAVAIAGSGRRTILVDAAGADAFDLPGGDLDGWLGGHVGLDRAARSPDGVSSLQVLHGRPSLELIASSTLRELLATPTAVVVVHVPGGSDAGDAIALAELVDHIVVVATARRDRGEIVARTHRWLSRDAHSEPVVVLAG